MPRQGAPSFFRQLGLPEILFFVLAAAALVTTWMGAGRLAFGLMLGATAVAVVVLWRLGLRALRQGIWKLQNRLLVGYLFIGVVPFLLLVVMAEAGAYMLTGQVGTFILKSELERRAASLGQAASSLARVTTQARPESIGPAGLLMRERLPGLEVLVKDKAGNVLRYPESSTLELPPAGHPESSGILVKDEHFYLWAHAKGPRSEVVILGPVTRTFLWNLMPGLGLVTIRSFATTDDRSSKQEVRVYSNVQGEPAPGPQEVAPAIGGPLRLLDLEVTWASPMEASFWSQPEAKQSAYLFFRTRMSGFLRFLFQQKSLLESRIVDAFITTVVLFLLVQVISAFVGISLSRSITNAVNALYEGTQRIQQGDLSNRIEVRGRDQLAELGRSFNSMTENLQRLLESEKERQRMHAELEIAREVQSQLHPRQVPQVGSLRVTSVCNAARMVSGDYFDYQALGESRLALCLGDVAGKGISAALLMATLQSAMRSQLRHCMEMAKVATGGADGDEVQTSKLVSNLNQQLYASTSPEKYATFFFSVYDDSSGIMTYTNAGHLPPILVRERRALMLDTNGMVVGAFPFARYGESQIRLEPGDLLVCYTDGITEPENEYGEMFGEERLKELLVAYEDREEEEIVGLIADAVRKWTNTPELQDDMTMLVARKL